MWLVAEPGLLVVRTPYWLPVLSAPQGKSPTDSGYRAGGRRLWLWAWVGRGVDRFTACGAADGNEWRRPWLLVKGLRWVPPRTPSSFLPFLLPASPVHPLLERTHAVLLIFLSSNPRPCLQTSPSSDPSCTEKQGPAMGSHRPLHTTGCSVFLLPRDPEELSFRAHLTGTASQSPVIVTRSPGLILAESRLAHPLGACQQERASISFPLQDARPGPLTLSRSRGWGGQDVSQRLFSLNCLWELRGAYMSPCHTAPGAPQPKQDGGSSCQEWSLQTLREQRLGCGRF